MSITQKKIKVKRVIKIFLYELNKFETQIWDLMSSEDGLDKEIFDEIKITEEETILSYAKVWRQMSSDIEQLKNEIDRLQKRKARFEAAASKIKEKLLIGMNFTDLKKISRPDISLAVKKNPPSLKIDIDAEIPEEYFTNNPVLDKKHLKEDIKKRDILMNEQKNTFNTKKAVWEETLKAQEEKIIKLNKQIKKLKEENK